MPSYMLDELILTLLALFQSFPIERVGGWVEGAITHPSFPRVHVSEAAKRAFLEQVGKAVRKGDGRGLKTAVKAFCGGKKKHTGGMPPKKKKEEGEEEEGMGE